MKDCTSIVIDRAGSVRGIYTDALDLRQVGGRLTCSRASSVEWSDDRQEWVCRTPEGEEIAHGPNREACISEEVRILGERL